MKKHLKNLINGSGRIQRREMKVLKGGQASDAFPVYECRVSPTGYTAGNVCLTNRTDKPATRCYNCYGVSYTIFIGYTDSCPYTCFQ